LSARTVAQLSAHANRMHDLDGTAQKSIPNDDKLKKVTTDASA
jgi:hypothetical protein